MPAEIIEGDLSRRLAALSPDKRAMLQRLIRSTAVETTSLEEIPIQPRGSARDFPLSAAQERMWFNHQWNPGQPLYSESFGLLLMGALNTDLLQKSFDSVMARHEIFTATFHSSGERLFQRIGSAVVPRMEIYDLRQTSEERREVEYEAGARKLLREPFRLQDGPLFRAGVWITGQDRYRVIFVMHHIIFDGWSGGIFLRELFSTYVAMTQGGHAELLPVGAQYVDFAVWEQSRFKDSPELDRQLEYWNKQLNGISGPPALPVDCRAPEDDIHAAGREIFLCPPESTAPLKILAKESGATLFMALLAAFQLLLARYSGQEDIVVGIPTTNRSHSALRNMVGVFINTAILRTEVSPEISFRELLGRVRKATLDAQENQEVPLQRVVRLLDGQGDSGRSLLRVLFDLQKKSNWLIDIPGLSIEPLDVSSGAAKFDLVLAFEETATELKGVLDYDAAIFEADTARQLARHFLALVESAVARPDMPVCRLPILTTEELAQTEARDPNTSQLPHPLPHEEAIARAREHPGAAALVAGGSSLSYGDMVARAMRVAAFLKQENVTGGQRVALLLPAGLDYVIAQLAVMIVGAAFVPIDPAYPATRVEFMLKDCDARFTVVNRASPSLSVTNVIDIDRDLAPPGPGQIVAASLRAGSDPAYLIYTSGSTGQPKGVSVSYAALANLVAWHRRAFETAASDRATQVASVAFDASIWEIWPYLAAGASIHFPSLDLIANPPGMRDWLLKHKITVSFLPTPLAEEVIALPWPRDGKLRYLLTGGDRLRKSPPANLPFPLVNNYGPTENTVVATSGVVAPSRNSTLPSIGRPIDNVGVRIVDAVLQPVPLGATGELIITGRSLANGYWNQPVLTSERFVTLASGERAYRTGDFCRFRRNGEIEFLGRVDAQVKLRGYRIELGEIETILLEHEQVRDAVADLCEFSNGQSAIVAYIVPQGEAVATEVLRTFLAARLTSYMLPSRFIRVDSLPKMPSGKIDRKRLPPPDAQGGQEKPQLAPRTRTELEIAALWKDLLRIDAVGVQDDFFQFGGDSLLATRLAAQIREKFAIELPLGQMMKAPTVEATAAFVDRVHPSANPLPPGVILLRSSGRAWTAGSLPPLFFTPPASGSPACYAALAGSLSGDRTVYGFEADGLMAGKPISSIAGQAAEYIAELNQLYPQGPCLLAGWSLGGPVAFEMACQLRTAGREVSFLGLIDAGLPENGRLPGGASMMVPLWWAISYPFVEHVPLNYATVRMLARWVGILLPESLMDVWRRGLASGTRFAVQLLASGWRSLQVFRSNTTAFYKYQPRFFDGEVTLFRTAQGGELDKGQDCVRRSLERWCRSVDIREAPGTHMTLMLEPNICSAFAASFNTALNLTRHAGGESQPG
jgi:amino acid adenylation domain-containing protein